MNPSRSRPRRCSRAGSTTARTATRTSWCSAPRAWCPKRRAPVDEPAPAPATRRRWLTGGDEEEAAPSIPAEKPKKSGGTLFERMAMASRGASKSDDDDDKDPLDIPRFLRSQNNQ